MQIKLQKHTKCKKKKKKNNSFEKFYKVKIIILN